MLQILPILLVSSLPPITVKPFVYQLKLEGDNHYVGITYNLNLRYAQHLSGNGAKWTRLHKPVSIQFVWTDGNVELENKITLELMKKYGKDKVRGGKWCKIDEPKIEPVEKKKEDNSDFITKRIRFLLDNEWVHHIMCKGYDTDRFVLNLQKIIYVDDTWYYNKTNVLIKFQKDIYTFQGLDYPQGEASGDINLYELNIIYRLYYKLKPFPTHCLLSNSELSIMLPFYNYFKP